METALLGRTGPGRAGLGHATGRNGPGPKLKFGPAGRAGPWGLRAGPGRQNPARADLWSGGSEFQSRGPMTEKALLPSDDLTYGMERTSESEDLVETECDGNERLL